jgi:aryl-alcohol dehydrogenase-like predicted oxidoreductase
VTPRRGDEPTSITPHDVLSQVVPAMQRLRSEGVVQHLGLTALGDPRSLAEILRSGQFVSVQVPYNILNPSAGQEMSSDFNETNYGNLLAVCQNLNVGAFAIRVFAGGALTGKPPSRHTLTTKFFPLDLYQRDVMRAGELRAGLRPDSDLAEVALRFAIAHPAITSALVGFGSPAEVEQAAACLQ